MTSVNELRELKLSAKERTESETSFHLEPRAS
jgi:hypothetical protein